MKTICIMCPMGCPLLVEDVGGEIKVEGNTCPRGAKYGVNEYLHPMRSVTTLANMQNGQVASVKTSDVVPKERVADVVKFIGELTLDSGVKIGDVVASDVLGLGVNVVVTGRR